MAKRPDQIEATFYAQVQPKFSRRRWDAMQQQYVEDVEKITVTSITQQRPQTPKGVVVKLTLRFNKTAFLPLAPQAIIEIPDNLTQVAQVIEVEAEDPNDAAAIAFLAQAAKNLP